MGRPGYWQAADGELVISTTAPATVPVVSDPTLINRTLVRVIGDIRLYAQRPPPGQAELGILMAVHLLGSGADLGAGNQNAFPDAWLWRKRSALYSVTWLPLVGRYVDTVDIHFDVSGSRKFTASRPTARFAVQTRDVPEPTGFIIAQFSMFSRVLFAPSEVGLEAEFVPHEFEVIDDRGKAGLPQPPLAVSGGLP